MGTTTARQSRGRNPDQGMAGLVCVKKHTQMRHMNAIISSRFRALTMRRDEILFDRAAIDAGEHDLRLFHINREILRQIDVTLSLARRWSDEPLSLEYIHRPVVPAERMAA